jgi:hypothetical protein
MQCAALLKGRACSSMPMGTRQLSSVWHTASPPAEYLDNGHCPLHTEGMHLTENRIMSLSY